MSPKVFTLFRILFFRTRMNRISFILFSLVLPYFTIPYPLHHSLLCISLAYFTTFNYRMASILSVPYITVLNISQHPISPYFMLPYAFYPIYTAIYHSTKYFTIPYITLLHASLFHPSEWQL